MAISTPNATVNAEINHHKIGFQENRQFSAENL
jgi:hypothetical protein